jgi:hypothetical protein
MICLRCGYCCNTSFVIIVDDPEKGIVEDNLIAQNGLESRCKHLIGDKPGEYSCAIHDKKWYKKTPCFSHGQIERSKDTPCRIGKYLLEKEEKKNDSNRVARNGERSS